MTLSWSMDKIGPIARSALDCALVFDAIRGRDAGDPASVDMPFPYDPTVDPASLQVGYVQAPFEEEYEGDAQLLRLTLEDETRRSPDWRDASYARGGGRDGI